MEDFDLEWKTTCAECTQQAKEVDTVTLPTCDTEESASKQIGFHLRDFVVIAAVLAARLLEVHCRRRQVHHGGDGANESNFG